MRFDGFLEKMLPQRLDILIAFKAISLAPDLSVTEKRVASALIDHFNRQTTQCDPSLDTLATLLGIHRRTVIRSVNHLVRLKYFRRTRHGGNFHRNFYEPLWPRFREVEAEWQIRRLKHSQRFREGNLPPAGCSGGPCQSDNFPSRNRWLCLSRRLCHSASTSRKCVHSGS